MSTDFLPASMPEGRTPVYFFSRNYFPTLTGATERFRRYLPGLATRGVDFYVITALTDPALPEIEHTGLEHIRRLPVGGDQFVDVGNLLLTMLGELQRAAPGTIQICGFTPNMRPLLRQLRKLGHRVLLVRTIMPSFLHPRLSLRGIERAIRIRLDASVVDRMTAGSTVMRDAYSSGSERLNRKYSIIPHGVDLDRFKPLDDPGGKAALRERLGLATDAITILSVGSVMERKRTHLIVGAFQELNALEPNSQLVIIGENKSRDTLSIGRLRDSFSRYSARVGECAAKCPPGSVTFTGEVGNVEEYYRAADVFAFASTIEGMPTAVIEAMASGLPCVVTPFSGLPKTEFGSPGQEFVLSGDDPSEIKEEMLKLVSDPARRLEIGGAARRFAASNLSSESAIDAYAELYHGRPPIRAPGPHRRL